MQRVVQFSVRDGYNVTMTLACGHTICRRGQWRWIGGGDGWWLKEPVRRRCPVCERCEPTALAPAAPHKQQPPDALADMGLSCLNPS